MMKSQKICIIFLAASFSPLLFASGAGQPNPQAASAKVTSNQPEKNPLIEIARELKLKSHRREECNRLCDLLATHRKSMIPALLSGASFNVHATNKTKELNDKLCDLYTKFYRTFNEIDKAIIDYDEQLLQDGQLSPRSTQIAQTAIDKKIQAAKALTLASQSQGAHTGNTFPNGWHDLK